MWGPGSTTSSPRRQDTEARKPVRGRCFQPEGQPPPGSPQDTETKGRGGGPARGEAARQGCGRPVVVSHRGSCGGPLCSSRLNSQVWLANWAYSSSPLMGFFS